MTKQEKAIQDAFLKDIIAHPDDDDRRLIYADWLSEHGDAAHGDLIGVQCELAKLEQGDPRLRALTSHQGYFLREQGDHCIKYAVRGDERLRECGDRWVARVARQGGLLPEQGERWLRLAVRQGELLREHGSRWVAALPSLPGLRWSRFERGFAFEADLGATAPGGVDAVRLQAARALAAQPVQSFWALAQPAVEAVLTTPGLERVRRLVLRFDPHSGEAEALRRSAPRLAGLTSLCLRGDWSRSWSRPRGLPGRTGSCRWAVGPTPLSGLRSLDLDCIGVGPLDARDLAGSPLLAGLTSLSLRGCGLAVEGLRELLAGPHLGRLRYLDLSRNYFRIAGARALAESPRLGQLHRLDVGYNRFGGVGWALLEERFGDAVR
jgi:uncharacterized protein (TIGR02996 family)